MTHVTSKSAISEELLAINEKLHALNAELVDASKSMRFVFQMMIDNFEIDTDTSCIKMKSKSDVVAEISIADIFKRYDAALAKATEQT